MVIKKKEFSKLSPCYLFEEIGKRKEKFLQQYKSAELISLGIGDTTLPLPEEVVRAMAMSAYSLATPAGYQGYGDEQGLQGLREHIALSCYHGAIDASEIFISDGAKCDLARLQLLFGPEVTIGIQDPSYPVYADGSILNGVENISLFPCTPSNGFFPDFGENRQDWDLFYLCHPNNPTGVAYTKEQLKSLIELAKERKGIVILDGAYVGYLSSSQLPRSLFSIEGGREVGIEVHSFSKLAGFSGLRLGWTVVPKELTFSDGSSVWEAWKRVYSTLFNGASILSQRGGIALFEMGFQKLVDRSVRYYLANAGKLKEAFSSLGYRVYGGDHAPYLWVEIARSDDFSSLTEEKSDVGWESFDFFLEKKQLIVTPGMGYGPSGKGFIRVSSFGHESQIESACKRLQEPPFFSLP